MNNHEIPYNPDMEKAEDINNVWSICAELKIQWEEGKQYLIKQRGCYREYVPFSDLPEEPIPF